MKEFSRRQAIFKIEYLSTVSNLLIFVTLVIFIPLIVGPLVIISFTFVTSLLMIFLIVALCGMYLFRGVKNRKVAHVVISAGDARFEGSGISTLAINSKGLSVVDSKTLRFSSLALFDTWLYFQNE